MTNQERSFLAELSRAASTSEIDGQINFLQALIDQGATQYEAQLFEAAKTDITAFSEWIEPEWFPARHHCLMLDKLQNIIHGENQRLIVSMPVGHAKSTYSSLVTPAFMFGLNPHQRIFAAGHTQNFVEQTISKKVRGIIQSERYKKVFPNTQVSNDSRAADYFSLMPVKGTIPGHYVAKGAGVGIAGYRATRIIADDLYPTLEDANNKGFRNKVKDWWYGDLMSRLLPGGNVVLVCTRWHGDDLIGHFLEEMEKGVGEKWDSVIMSALCEDEENDPLGRKEGEALWPEFYTAEALRDIKATRSARIWNCLYQSNPVNEGGGIVQNEWFRYWEQLPPENMVRRRFVSFDTANTANARSDYTVGTAWAETFDNKYYLVDIVRQRVEFPELIKLVDEFARRNRASAIMVEDAGHGKALLQSKQGMLFAPLIAINPYNKNKEFRFDEISPLFETGAVLLPKHHDIRPDVEKELLEFPNGSKDDIVDSVTHALRWARGSTIRRGTKKLKGMH